MLTNDSDAQGDTLTVTSVTIVGDPTVYAPGEPAMISNVGVSNIGPEGSFVDPLPTTTGPCRWPRHRWWTASAAPDREPIIEPAAAVNDAPVNTVPGAQTVNEDTALRLHRPGADQRRTMWTATSRPRS